MPLTLIQTRPFGDSGKGGARPITEAGYGKGKGKGAKGDKAPSKGGGKR